MHMNFIAHRSKTDDKLCNTYLSTPCTTERASLFGGLAAMPLAGTYVQ